jgi:hypothetical protein
MSAATAADLDFFLCLVDIVCFVRFGFARSPARNFRVQESTLLLFRKTTLSCIIFNKYVVVIETGENNHNQTFCCFLESQRRKMLFVTLALIASLTTLSLAADIGIYYYGTTVAPTPNPLSGSFRKCNFSDTFLHLFFGCIIKQARRLSIFKLYPYRCFVFDKQNQL